MVGDKAVAVEWAGGVEVGLAAGVRRDAANERPVRQQNGDIADDGSAREAGDPGSDEETPDRASSESAGVETESTKGQMDTARGHANRVADNIGFGHVLPNANTESPQPSVSQHSVRSTSQRSEASASQRNGAYSLGEDVDSDVVADGDIDASGLVTTEQRAGTASPAEAVRRIGKFAVPTSFGPLGRDVKAKATAIPSWNGQTTQAQGVQEKHSSAKSEGKAHANDSHDAQDVDGSSSDVVRKESSGATTSEVASELIPASGDKTAAHAHAGLSEIPAVVAHTSASATRVPVDSIQNDVVVNQHGDTPPDMTLPGEAPTVNAAAIAARAAESLRHGEMHVGWQSEQLGRVDIRATVHGQELAAAVKVESDAGRQWIAAELPKLADTLQRQEFTVRSLQVSNFSAGDSKGQQSGSQQQQRAWSSGGAVEVVRESEAVRDSEGLANDLAVHTRLSIRV
jgi:hypothetical protein